MINRDKTSSKKFSKFEKCELMLPLTSHTKIKSSVSPYAAKQSNKTTSFSYEYIALFNTNSRFSLLTFLCAIKIL